MTFQTTSTTQTLPWHYHSHLVMPLSMILHYEFRTLYLLRSGIAKKPKHPV